MAVVALLSLCVGALPSCPSAQGPDCVAKIGGGFYPARVVEASRDETWAAVAGRYRQLSFFNIVTGAQVAAPTYYGVDDVSFSPDSTLVVVADINGVGVFRAGTTTQVWYSTQVYATSVSFSPDGLYVASSHMADTIHIRDAATGDRVSALAGALGGVGDFHYTPDGTRIIAGGGGARYPTVGVWDVSSGARIRDLQHAAGVMAMAVSPDGRYLAVASGQDIAIRSLEGDYSVLRTIASVGIEVRAMSFNRDGSKLVVTGSGPSIFIYRVSTGDKHSTYPADSPDTWAVTFLHNTDRFLTASSTSTVTSLLLLWAAADVRVGGPVELLKPGKIYDVKGFPAEGAEVPIDGMTLVGVPPSLQGSSNAHGTTVVVGDKLRLSCASGTCEFVVAVYSCKPCADAANDFEAQMVVDGFTPWPCAPSFSVASGSTQHVMRAFHTHVVSGTPVVLDAVVHATKHVVAFAVNQAVGLPQPWCPTKAFAGPAPECTCISP